MASDTDSQSAAEDAKVIVTLVASNSGPHSSIPTRRIALQNNIPERVGRASKVATKGFVSTPENAWFDSPVMSRTHAELIAHLDTKTVFIKDTGSLHGTFITKKDTPDLENRLAEHNPTELTSGDKIRFGIEILRGRDTFPPCEVDVTMEWPNSATSPPQRSTSTNRFTVPDAEDEDMLSDTESVMVMEEEFTLPDVNQAVIDLTEESASHPSGRRRARARLTSKGIFTTEYSSDVIDLTSEIDADDNSSIHGSLPGDWPTPNKSTDLEDNQQEIANSGPSQSSVQPPPNSLNEASQGSCDTLEPSQAPEVISDLVAQQSDNVESFAMMPSYLLDTNDDEDGDSFMSDESVNLYEGCCPDTSDSESSSDDEENLDSHWSSDNDEDMDEHTNSDDSEGDDASGLDEPSYDAGDIVSESESESEVVETSIFDKTSIPSQSPESSPVAISTKPIVRWEPVNLTPEVTINHSSKTLFGSSSDGESMQAASPPNLLKNSTAITRQPSPSDAAMVKPGPIPAGKTTAQVLGEKTGKFEYFAARDQNKATVVQGRPLTPRPCTTGQQAMPLSNQESKRLPVSSSHKDDTMSHDIELSIPPPPWRKSTGGSVSRPILNPTPAIWSNFVPFCGEAMNARMAYGQEVADLSYAPSIWPGDSFSNSSDVQITQTFPDPEKRTRLQSPEHDMTSAYTFQRSKQAAGKPGNEIKVMRNTQRMAIPALLAGDSEKASSPASPLYSPPSPIGLSPPPKPRVPITFKPGKRMFDEVFHLEDSEDNDGHEGIYTVPQSPQLGKALSTPSQVQSSSTKDAATITASVVKPSTSFQETAVTQVQASNRPTEAPPAKRRRLADFAACALGGAIGGAAVLVGLITSAPSISQM